MAPNRQNAEIQQSCRFYNDFVVSGMKLANAQTKVAVAQIIRNFDVKVCPDGQKKPILPDPNVFVFRAAGKLLVTLHKRTSWSP